MKYRVTIPFACFVSVEVEADGETEARELAEDQVSIGNYAGNGGWDKLIGVSESSATIEAGEEDIDGIGPFNTTIEVIEG